MKTFIFYVCIFSLVPFILADDTPKRPGEEHKSYNKCLQKYNISRHDMFTDYDIIYSNIPETNTELIMKNGCVYQCVMEKMGLMEGSEFKVNEIRTKFAERENAQQGQEALMLACINRANDKLFKCEKSLTFVACYIIAEHKWKQILRP